MADLNHMYFYHLTLFLLLLIKTTQVGVWCIMSLLRKFFYSEWSFVKSTFVRVFTQGRRKKEKQKKVHLGIYLLLLRIRKSYSNYLECK